MSDTALRLDRVTRTFKEGEGTLEIFRDVSFAIQPGELVALVGPSGAGKSSLLHIAGLLEAPSSGEVIIGNQSASSLPDAERTRLRRDTIGFIYQAHHLLPEFDALENVVLPQLIAGKPRKEAQQEAKRLLTALGLACAWWVMRHLGRGHEGMNVPDVQLAVVRRGGEIPAVPALARTAASAITLGGGGSAGSEGPVAVLGSAIGSFLGRAFQSSPTRMQVLVGAGAAAGISAAFNAPLAGAFFAIEEILGSFAVGSFPPIVVSSVIAAVVSRAAFGNHPAFPIPQQYGYALAREVFLFYPLLGVVTGLASVLYVRSYFSADGVARRLRVPRAALPWIGGLLVGLIVFASKGVLVGYGHLAVRLEVFGRMAWYALALLAIGKIIATAITLNFGGSGGVFTPSLYIGAATGGAFGAALAALFPGLHLHPEAYALVGMGALIAGATDAPVTGILIVFEMTND